MGLLSMLGYGGGDLELTMASQVLDAGGVAEGNVVFVGGERVQTIQRIVIEIECLLSKKRHDPKLGWITDETTEPLIAETAISGAFSTQAGQRYEFPFRLLIPDDARPSRPDAVEYTLKAYADIDGEIDPSQELVVEIVHRATSQSGPTLAGSAQVSVPRLTFPSACPHCGAAMDPPGPGLTTVTCPFCSRTHQGTVLA